jgi:hypothetical protein
MGHSGSGGRKPTVFKSFSPAGADKLATGGAIVFTTGALSKRPGKGGAALGYVALATYTAPQMTLSSPGWLSQGGECGAGLHGQGACQ